MFDKFSYHFCYLLLCVSNILNSVLDRGDIGVVQSDVASPSRFIIQMFYGIILVVMLVSILRKKAPAFCKPLSLFCFILIFYFIHYWFFPSNFGNLNTYIRFCVNIAGFYFFYYSADFLPYGVIKKYIQIYVITAIIAASVKISVSSLASLDAASAGDTASITLVFVIPLIFLFFRGKNAILLFLIAFVFTLASVRRTSILGFIISVPFIYGYLKMRIKPIHLVAIACFSCVVLYNVWEHYSVVLTTRFDEMLDAKSNETFGSGRSEFYTVLWEDYVDHPENYLLGFGLNRVYDFYQMKGYTYLPHAHNDVLEIIYTFGAIGLFLWISFWLKIYRAGTSMKDNTSRRLLNLSIILYIIVALASGTILRIEMLPICLSIAIIISLDKNRHENTLLF